jgi:hypothetical protein
VGFFADGVFTPIADNRQLGGLPNNTAGFVPVNLDLSQFIGKQGQVQFRFTSDATGTAEGWFVDDVKVTAGGPTSFTVGAGQAVLNVDFGGVQVADAGPDRIAPAGQPVSFTGVVRDPDPNNGANFTYAWSVVSNNGQVVPGASTQNFSFTPSAAGTYTVSFTVTDHDDNNRVYLDTAVITVPLVGDATGDGKVDNADFQVLRNNFGGVGKTLAEGDLNGDSVVDFADFQILERNFGKTAPPPPAPVPEVPTAPTGDDEVLVPTTPIIPTPTPKPLPRPKPVPVARPTVTATTAAPAATRSATQTATPKEALTPLTVGSASTSRVVAATPRPRSIAVPRPSVTTIVPLITTAASAVHETHSKPATESPNAPVSRSFAAAVQAAKQSPPLETQDPAQTRATFTAPAKSALSTTFPTDTRPRFSRRRLKSADILD